MSREHQKLRFAALVNLALLGLFGLLSVSCGVSNYEKAASVATLDLNFGDQAWTMNKIPAGQQCKKFGGNGSSPEIVVHHIPKDANAVIVEFSDRSWFPMNHGGHGKLGIRLAANQTEVTIPSVHAETFDLPDNANLFIYSAHRGGRGAPGAYLPPCSGGRGNKYYADVKAVKQLGEDWGKLELVAENSLFLGSY